MCVNVSHDGKYIISGDYSGNIIIWDFENTKEVSNLKAHEGEVTSVNFSPDSK